MKSRRPATNHNKSAVSTEQPAVRQYLQRHRYLVRLLLAVLVPILLLGTTEGLLRVFSVGYPTSLFLKVDGTDSYGMNRQFGWRFFPRKIARKPVPQHFAIHKPERTCRIFTLGASAALGVPNSAFSFSRSLEVMLKSRYPGVQFEFVNTALTAINSHVVLPIAKECASYEPDVYVVYLGNNEVIGPYGIGASANGAASDLRLVRAGIALRSTRIGQLLQRLAESRRDGDLENNQWRGMKMYSRNMINWDNPALQTVRDNFSQNLHDIGRAGLKGGAKVVFSTVPVNLRSSPPFAAVIDSTAPPQTRDHVKQLLFEASDLIAAGHPQAAMDTLAVAYHLDNRCANVQYLRGQAQLALGNRREAEVAFVNALEYDALRFRTDQHLNNIIRQTAQDLAPDGSFLADTEQALRASDPSGTGIPGDELFYEHVHLTFQGNYLVARSLLPVVEQALPDWVQAYAANSTPVPTIDDCARALLYTGANEYLNLAQMRTTVTPYPFTAQLGYDQKLAGIDHQLNALRAQATPDVQRATLESYQNAYRQNPQDLLLAINFAKLLALTGNNKASNQVMERVLASQPPAADLDAVDMAQLSGGG